MLIELTWEQEREYPNPGRVGEGETFMAISSVV